jgi:hypothetical protein
MPPLGIWDVICEGRKDVTFEIPELMLGIITPGWVKNTIKNVSAYP